MKKIISLLLVLTMLFGVVSAVSFNSFAVCNHQYAYGAIHPATTEADGYIETKCVYCGVEGEDKVIPSIENFSLFPFTYNYTGKAVKPAVHIFDRTGHELVENVDYDVTYPESPINPGLYVITVTYMGHYTGSEDQTYNILKPAKPAKPVVKATASATAIALKWNNCKASYYAVIEYNASTKKYTVIAKTANLSYTITGRKSGTVYRYLVRAYNGTTGSDYSSKDIVTVVTLCNAPAPKASVSGKTVTLKWAKVTGAKYYVAYKYNTKTKKYSAIKKFTANSIKLANQPKGNNYYLVRAFNASNAGSAFSTKNLVKAVVKR